MGVTKWGLAVLLIAVFPIHAATATPERSIFITNVNYKYDVPRALSSVRAVDFENLGLVTFDKDGHPSPKIQLRNGSWHGQTGHSDDETGIRGIYYFKGRNEGTEHALLELQDVLVGGSSIDIGTFLVFEVRNGQLYATQQIEYDDHAQGTFARFFPKAGILCILGRTWDTSPHCCPESFTDVVLEWDGKQFKVQSTQKLILDKKTPKS